MHALRSNIILLAACMYIGSGRASTNPNIANSATAFIIAIYKPICKPTW